MECNVKIKQALNLLYSFRYILEPVPAFLMLVNCVMHLLFVRYTWSYVAFNVPVNDWIYPEWYELLNVIMKQFFEISFTTWLVLFSLSKTWGILSKGSLYFMLFLLIVNLCFVSTDAVDKYLLYFYASFSILFLIFFFLAIFVVSKYN